MELDKQRDLVKRFRNWFDSGGTQGKASIKTVIEDNRRRYRMILKDEAERVSRGLSALASTKSTSIVDNAVVDSLQEYFASDAMTYTAQDSGDVNKDHVALFLTELFKLRAKKNGFWVWLTQSLKAGYVDGIEAGMVRWRKESYTVPDNHYFRMGQEISREEYNEAKKQKWPLKMEGAFNPEKGAPDIIKIRFEDVYQAQRQKVERTVTDTWEVCQLKPGESLLWDFKNPLLDLDKGQWAIAILGMTLDQMLTLSKQGIFKRGLSEDDLKPNLQHSIQSGNYTDYTSVGTDPDTVDMGDFNLAEVWVMFEKVNHRWMVSFSIKGEFELSTPKPVNDIFFGGRQYDGLPVFMGASDIELWEAIGRGIPKLIAPLEDELTDHKNNVNDIAKQAVQGRWRVNDDSDADIDSILNSNVFFAKQGEVEKLDMSGEMAVAMRAADGIGQDIAEVAPVGMQSQYLVPQGGPQGTLGGTQLALGNNDKKLSTRLLIRNITVMEKMLRITAEMIMAFETDQTLGRIAAKAAKVDTGPNGPLTAVVDGKPQIDFSQLDFDVEIQINAGLGNVPKQQKCQKMLQAAEWAKANGKKLDIDKIWAQTMVLNGFSEDQFDLPADKQPPPQPPPVDYKMTINADLQTVLSMDPSLAPFLSKLMTEGHMNIEAKLKEESDKKTPPWLKDQPQGSISHPAATMQGNGMDQHQGQMGGA